MGLSEKGSRIIRICESGMRVVLVGMMMMVSSTSSSVVVLMDPKISSTPSTTTFMTLLRGRIRSWLSSPPYPFIAMILILLLLIIINILVSSSQSPPPLSSGVSTEDFTSESYNYCWPQEIWSKEEKVSAAGHHGEVVGGGGEDEYQSLEETWKAITNGAPPAATGTGTGTRLQQVMISKCEIWRDMLPPPCGGGGGSSSRREKMMKKSNTFVEGGRRCTSGYRGKGSDELMLSQDELNKRVEEFIRKCKNKMRLERVESDERQLYGCSF